MYLRACSRWYSISYSSADPFEPKVPPPSTSSSDAVLGVQMVPTWYACCFNGEGMCYTTLTGPGTAWVQSMPWARFKKHMGVTIQLDKDGNVKNVGGPPAAEMARN